MRIAYWEFWEYSAQCTKHIKGFCSVIPRLLAFSDTWSKVPQTDQITENSYIVWGKPIWFYWTFSKPEWVSGSSLWATEKSDIVCWKPIWFIKRFPTQDEWRVHHFEPEANENFMQWKHRSSTSPKKFIVFSSARKVLVSVLSDAKFIVFIDCLQKGHTINIEYYSKFLRELWNPM